MVKRILLIGVGLIIVIGIFAYFVGGVSATYPPIRKYEYKGNINQFGNLLQVFEASNPKLKYKISARDSSNLNVNYRDITIDINDGANKISYALDCTQNEKDHSSLTEIDLVEAINTINNTGGYIEKAPGVKPLVNYLEKNVLLKLQTEQHANIHPKKEGFFERINIY